MKSPVRRTRSGARALMLVDDALEEEGLGVLVEVDVADLDDAVAVEGGGEIGGWRWGGGRCRFRGGRFRRRREQVRRRWRRSR